MTKQLEQLIQNAQWFLSLESDVKHTRCSGCGNYGIMNATMRAITLLGHAGHEVIFVYDVGCSGNGSDKLMVNTIHGLHGRSLPLASWVHLANPEIPIVVMAGDGATLSEWVNHLIHTARNNYNITFLLHNNHNYGLTTGQASSTTPKGCHHKGTVGETTATPLIPSQLVLSSGGTFVARGYSGDVDQLTELIMAWITHKWFSFVEILQLCPTYSKATSAERYDQRIYKVNDRDDYDPSDKHQAYQTVEDFDHLATGILYQNKDHTHFYEEQVQRQGMKTMPVDEVVQFDVSGLIEEFLV